MLADKRLVVFGTRMGLGFSGGSNATILLLEHMLNGFGEVIILCREKGEIPFEEKLQIVFWEKETDIIPLLNSWASEQTIFYGDFQDAMYLVEAKLPFFFTYHDNWPEQKRQDYFSFFQSFRIIPKYARIFKAAQHVFSVTEKKRAFIDTYTSLHSLARNGASLSFQKRPSPQKQTDAKFSILMLGNIDKRKFHYAAKLFRLLDRDPIIREQIEIHIFGHPLKDSLTKSLAQYPFVSCMGFKKEIKFEEYELLLSCSFIENLPISMLEALQHELPILSFDIGGVSELIEHEADGILIPPFALNRMQEELKNIMNTRYTFSFPKEKLVPFNWEYSAKHMLEKMRAYFHA
ncbi:MAG: glycosyltransferase family 4 protein [Bacteroidota bacterium]